MLESMVELIIGITAFAVGAALSLIACFTTENSFVIFGSLACGIIICIPFVYLSNTDKDKEDAAKELQEKAQINSLSCQGLGSYIIEHSSNNTSSYDTIESKTYKYAEAKYLVCTHGGLSN